MSGPEFSLQGIQRTYASTRTSPYNEARCQMQVFNRDASGAIDVNNPVATFSEFLMQTAEEEEKEKYQFMESSDSNKLFGFGTEHVYYSLTGELLDTNIRNAAGEITIQENTWGGKSYKDFVEFVDNFANVGHCAKFRRLVSISYANKTIYGAFTSVSTLMSADQPHKVTAVCQFFVVGEDNNGA